MDAHRTIQKKAAIPESKEAPLPILGLLAERIIREWSCENGSVQERTPWAGRSGLDMIVLAFINVNQCLVVNDNEQNFIADDLANTLKS